MLEPNRLRSSIKMFHRSHANSLRARRLRGMALFLLLFTLADVSFLAPCSETNEILPAASKLSVQWVSGGVVADQAKATSTSDSPPDQSPEKGCCDEDCCFLCAHALSPIAVTEVAVVEMKSLSITPPDRFVPEPPLRSTYHPPRFA